MKLLAQIPLSEIDEFPDHPFRVVEDEAMRDMVESVKQYGVLTPAVVRKKEDGRYELISGHRRKKACELAGIDKLPVVVKDMSRDEAPKQNAADTAEMIISLLKATPEVANELMQMLAKGGLAGVNAG